MTLSAAGKCVFGGRPAYGSLGQSSASTHFCTDNTCMTHTKRLLMSQCPLWSLPRCPPVASSSHVLACLELTRSLEQLWGMAHGRLLRQLLLPGLGPALLVALEARLPAQAPATSCLRNAAVRIAAQPTVLAHPPLPCVPQSAVPSVSSARLGCLSFGT